MMESRSIIARVYRGGERREANHSPTRVNKMLCIPNGQKKADSQGSNLEAPSLPLFAGSEKHVAS